jgi:hypothetical protein
VVASKMRSEWMKLQRARFGFPRGWGWRVHGEHGELRATISIRLCDAAMGSGSSFPRLFTFVPRRGTRPCSANCCRDVPIGWEEWPGTPTNHDSARALPRQGCGSAMDTIFWTRAERVPDSEASARGAGGEETVKRMQRSGQARRESVARKDHRHRPCLYASGACTSHRTRRPAHHRRAE